MDKLAVTDWIAIISALGMILSVVVTVSTLIGRNNSKVAADTELKTDVKYIREQTDKTEKSLQDLNDKIDGVDIRLTRVEESCKSAHHRIDGLECRKN